MTIKTKLSIAVALLAMSGVASAADTCASPTVLDGSAPITNLSGNTCNGSAQAVSLCGAFDYSQKKEIIYSFQLGATKTATAISLTNVQAGYTPAMYVTSSACAAADTCDANGTTSVSLTGLTAGTPYFLIITTTPAAAAANCGTYGLNTDGTLPVRLNGFSVQ